MSAPPTGTVVFSAPCPTCGQVCTWLTRPGTPPTSRCDQPTCRVNQVIER